MFSEFPKLLNRDFALGYLLPAALFVAGTLYLLQQYGHLSDDVLASLLDERPWFGATIVAVASWLFGLVLLALNRILIRLREGYLLPPLLARKLRSRQVDKFRSLRSQIDSLQAERRRVTSAQHLAKLNKELTNLATRLTRHFPDKEEFILPTMFGNILRSFEVYPRVLYGAEAIVVWPRILGIVSDSQRQILDQAKANVDFWVNLGLVAILIVFEYIALSVLTLTLGPSSPPTIAFVSPLVPLLGLVSVPATGIASRHSALSWGAVVKATFDLYLPELRKKLELPPASSRKEQREIWMAYSRAALFHLPTILPEPAPSVPVATGNKN